MKEVILAVVTLSGLGFVFGLLLAWVSKKFHLKVDPKLRKVSDLLPNINCGACGLAGCSSFAEALVNKEEEISSCIACTTENKKVIAQALGLSSEDIECEVSELAVVGCQGGLRCKDRFKYKGLKDCRIAKLTLAGAKECQYGCLGQDTCVQVCPFGAIRMQEDQIPKIDPDRCLGCKKCVVECPRKIIFMVDRRKEVYIKCSSCEKAPQMMKKCRVGCIACSKCVNVCPVMAITIENNLARIDYQKCINCKKCVEVCPTKVINISYEKK